MIVDYSLDIERLFMSNVGCKPLAFPHKRVFAILLNGLFPGAHSNIKVPLVIQPLASAESRGLTKSVCTLVSDPDVCLAVVRHELSA